MGVGVVVAVAVDIGGGGVLTHGVGKGGIYSWCCREGYSECRTRWTGFTAGVAGGGLHNTARGCGGGVLLSRSAVGGATSDQWQLRVEDSGRLPERLLEGRVETLF